MSKPSKNPNIFDNDHDNESWSQKEITLSSKLLVAIGGITSIGGIIPLIIKNFSQLDNDISVGPGFFLIFTLVYFTGPLLIFWAWSSITNRIIKPVEGTPKPWLHFLSWLWNIKKYPVTYRYKWLLILHIICIGVYLYFSIYCEYVYTLLWLGLLLILSPTIAVITFTKRIYQPKKLKRGLIIGLGIFLMLGFGSGVSYFYIQDIDTNVKARGKSLPNTDFDRIAEVEKASARLAHLEKDLVNEADRFFILSSMNAWNVLNLKETGFEDSVDLSAFKIDSSISILNQYLIDDNARSLSPQYDNYIAAIALMKKKVHEGKKKKIKFFIPHNPFCENHFIVQRDSAFIDKTNRVVELGKYYNQLFLATEKGDSIMKSVLNIKKEKKFDFKDANSQAENINFKMGMVNGYIDTMLFQGMHRLYPSCFSHFIIFPDTIDKSSIAEVCKPFLNFSWDTHSAHYPAEFCRYSLKLDMLPLCYKAYIDTLLNPTHAAKHKYGALRVLNTNSNDSLTIYGIRLTSDVKNKLAVTMNRYNSRIFKDWIESMYLPYAQRKTGQEIQTIAEDTSWIWKEIKYMGIIISITTLLLLSIQYLELIDLKNYIIHEQLLPKDPDSTLEEKQIAKGKIADLDQKANYLLFPLTTTITIVAILLIPVTTKTEIANIEPTKSFRMLQVPSLNLPSAVKDVVNNDDREKRDSELIQLQKEISKLSNEIDTLSKSIVKLKVRKDSSDISSNLEKIDRTLNKQNILLNRKSADLEKKIAEVKRAVDNSKRR